MRKLAYLLNYQISTIALFFLSGLGIIFIIIAMITSIIFTTFMLHVLYNEKKYGWIIFFSIIVIIPTLLNFSHIESPLFKSSINLIILGIVYSYYFLLRLTINDWVEEDLAKKQRIYETQNEKQESGSLNEKIK
jgi:hypothetical protein